jgi:hypothetical protein
MKDNYNKTKPILIEFNRIGSLDLGFLSIAQGEKIPFDVKRLFWTYFTPEEIVRGRHAHFETEMILLAMSGRIIVNTEMPDGKKDSFILDRPNIGVYLPKLCWHTMLYQHNAVQLVIASREYNELDYIRSYDDFLKLSL